MTMSEISKSTSQSETESVSTLSKILLADGEWHKVTNPEKVEFSVSSSPATDGPYTYLKYQNESGQTNYIPFRQICGFQFNSNR